jgi:hypothetical protein
MSQASPTRSTNRYTAQQLQETPKSAFYKAMRKIEKAKA